MNIFVYALTKLRIESYAAKSVSTKYLTLLDRLDKNLNIQHGEFCLSNTTSYQQSKRKSFNYQKNSHEEENFFEVLNYRN